MKTISRRGWTWIACVWTFTITLGMLAPLPALQSLPGSEEGFRIVGLDKLVHATMFFGFGWLWLRALGDRPSRRVRVAASGVTLAVATELLQALPVLQRDANVDDMIADLIGLAAAFAASHLEGSIRAKRSSRASASPDNGKEAHAPRPAVRPRQG